MSGRQSAAEPETLAQARAWDRTKARYVKAGFCHRCASQAAWGHQTGGGGYATIKPPCVACAKEVLPDSIIKRHGYRAAKWLAAAQAPVRAAADPDDWCREPVPASPLPQRPPAPTTRAGVRRREEVRAA